MFSKITSKTAIYTWLTVLEPASAEKPEWDAVKTLSLPTRYLNIIKIELMVSFDYQYGERQASKWALRTSGISWLRKEYRWAWVGPGPQNKRYENKH